VRVVAEDAPYSLGGKPPLSLQPSAVPEPLLEAGVAQPHIINVGVAHGVPSKTWRHIMTADVLPRLAAFKPDLILVSAGFDAHQKVSVACVADDAAAHGATHTAQLPGAWADAWVVGGQSCHCGAHF
jgi:hypothetical protein